MSSMPFQKARKAMAKVGQVAGTGRGNTDERPSDEREDHGGARRIAETGTFGRPWSSSESEAEGDTAERGQREKAREPLVEPT